MYQRPDPEAIDQALQHIRESIHRTPVLTCSAIDQKVGAQLFFKCENFQKSGSFKFRGASHAVLSLEESQASRGVLTHSSGNYAAALALAARNRGIPAYIVMPSNAPAVKQAAVKEYGGEITICEPTMSAREERAAEIQKRTGAHLIHTFNNPHNICGYGTAAFELLEEVPELEVILAPTGGGGLLSGTLIAAKGLKPDIQVMAGASPYHRRWPADESWRRDLPHHQGAGGCHCPDQRAGHYGSDVAGLGADEDRRGTLRRGSPGRVVGTEGQPGWPEGRNYSLGGQRRSGSLPES